jgi:hypothetical protein
VFHASKITAKARICGPRTLSAQQIIRRQILLARTILESAAERLTASAAHEGLYFPHSLTADVFYAERLADGFSSQALVVVLLHSHVFNSPLES